MTKPSQLFSEAKVLLVEDNKGHEVPPDQSGSRNGFLSNNFPDLQAQTASPPPSCQSL